MPSSDQWHGSSQHASHASARVEGEVANLRRRVREAELISQSEGVDGALVGDLEERLRIAGSKVRQLEGVVQNEKARREGAEAEPSRPGLERKDSVTTTAAKAELLGSPPPSQGTPMGSPPPGQPTAPPPRRR